MPKEEHLSILCETLKLGTVGTVQLLLSVETFVLLFFQLNLQFLVVTLQLNLQILVVTLQLNLQFLVATLLTIAVALGSKWPPSRP